MEDQFKRYVGKDIVILYYTEKCTHSGNCLSGSPGVFDVNKRPWVHADGDTADNIASQIHKCPSGALEYIRKDVPKSG